MEEREGGTLTARMRMLVADMQAMKLKFGGFRDFPE
jgi:hypothetical protein